MTRRPEEALAETLAAIARGMPVEAAIARYPEYADELRSLIQVATDAGLLRPGTVSPDAVRRSRARALSRAATLASTKPRGAFLAPAMRFAFAAVAVVVVLGVTGVGLNSAAADSLPGDPLYGVKLAAETLRLRFATAAESRLELEDLYAEQRVDEVMALLALGRKVPVSFEGEVRRVGPVLWDVAGVVVRLTSDTRILGEILPGMDIEVEGITQGDGTVLAHELHLHAYDTVGALKAIEAGSLTVDGADFAILAGSHIEPGLAIGERVLARIGIEDSGARHVISVIRFAAPDPTATLAPPTPASTATPVASSTPQDDKSDDEKEDPEDRADETETSESEEDDDSDEDGSGDAEKLEFEGLVESISGSTWVVSGRSLAVTGDTEIRDSPSVGDTVKVVAFSRDGSWWAQRIELED